MYNKNPQIYSIEIITENLLNFQYVYMIIEYILKESKLQSVTMKILRKKPKVYLRRRFPGGSAGKEFVCSAGDRRHRRHEFDPWVGKMLWRRKWIPTPVSLPGKFHQQRSLGGYIPWGLKESDTTEHKPQCNKSMLKKGIVALWSKLIDMKI